MTSYYRIVLALAALPGIAAGPRGFVKLFNGRDLSGFDIVVKGREMNQDPKKVFQVQNGAVHVSGEEYGYILTKQEYADYHLRAEFKWGEATHEPRKDKPRDSGILFHVGPPYTVWPPSIEFQIIEGRTGEIILVGDGTGLTVNGVRRVRAPGQSSRFAKFGQGPWESVIGYRDPTGEVEKPRGEWNLMELIAERGHVKLLVNGKLVNEGSDATPARGRILFQSEGAECFFRNIELRQLDKQ
jgi:hypothetical protein